MPLNQDLEQYYLKLLNLAEKITKGNKIDAKDLVQDLYVIILEYDTRIIYHGTNIRRTIPRYDYKTIQLAYYNTIS